MTSLLNAKFRSSSFGFSPYASTPSSKIYFITSVSLALKFSGPQNWGRGAKLTPHLRISLRHCLFRSVARCNVHVLSQITKSPTLTHGMLSRYFSCVTKWCKKSSLAFDSSADSPSILRMCEGMYRFRRSLGRCHCMSLCLEKGYRSGSSFAKNSGEAALRLCQKEWLVT